MQTAMDERGVSACARGAAACLFMMCTPAAWAVPSFARQTGMACEACHTVYPELTHFGRVFKANGYVLDNLKQVRDVDAKKNELLALAQIAPLSIMAQVSYTQIKTGLPREARHGERRGRDSQGGGRECCDDGTIREVTYRSG